MAIIGYDTQGTAGSTTTENTIVGAIFDSGAGGEIEKITAYLVKAGSAAHTIKCAIYTTGDALVANSETSEVSPPETGWSDFGYSGARPTLAPSTNYRFVIWANSGLGSFSLVYDAGTTNQGGTDSETYAADFPDPATFVGNDFKYSIYATIAEAGDAVPVFNNHYRQQGIQ
jgi:hypothetical protein